MHPPPRPLRPRRVARARGAVLLFALVLLLILLLASVALVRSTLTNNELAGGLSFKRDLQLQAGRGIQAAENELGQGGSLSSATSRESDQIGSYYSATMLPSNAQGIPTVLIDAATSNPGSGTVPVGEIDPPGQSSIVDPVSGKTVATGITIYYVIDRLCTSAGAITSASTCVLHELGQDKGGTAWLKKAGGALLPVYRISVAVVGPHNAQTYVQQLVTE